MRRAAAAATGGQEIQLRKHSVKVHQVWWPFGSTLQHHTRAKGFHAVLESNIKTLHQKKATRSMAMQTFIGMEASTLSIGQIKLPCGEHIDPTQI